MLYINNTTIYLTLLDLWTKGCLQNINNLQEDKNNLENRLQILETELITQKTNNDRTSSEMVQSKEVLEKNLEKVHEEFQTSKEKLDDIHHQYVYVFLY